MVATNPTSALPSLTFTAQLYVVAGVTIARVPDDVSKKLSSRGQVAVTGTMNGHDVQIVIEPDGQFGHWFKVDGALQKRVSAVVGDDVTLEITQTKDWPEPDMPADFAKSLAVAPAAVQSLWTKITPMARWEWIRWINATNSTETRERRVEVSISKLQSGKRRPCCFNLAACTDPQLSKNGQLMKP